MADQTSPPQPPIFNLNAYSPAEIKEAVEKVGIKKATLPVLTSFMLAVIAGGSIGLGALYYTIIVSDAELSFATARVMGGLAFSLGLVIVLVGGAELFTGNNLIVMAWASGDVTTKQMLRNWVVVYFGNLIGETDNLTVTSKDYTRVRSKVGQPAAIDSPLDFDRDGRVTALDQRTARANLSHSLVPLVAPSTAPAAAASPIVIPRTREKMRPLPGGLLL